MNEEERRSERRSARRLMARVMDVTVAVSRRKTLAEVLHPTVLKSAERQGLGPELRSTRVEALASPQEKPRKPAEEEEPGGRGKAITQAVNEWVIRAKPAERLVLDKRILTKPKRTLAEVGAEAGKTRQRMQQVHAKVVRTLDGTFRLPFRALAEAEAGSWPPVMDTRAWKAVGREAVPGAQGLARRLAQRLLETASSYTEVEGWWLSPEAQRVLGGLKWALPEVSDPEGLVDIGKLKRRLPVKGDWEQWWPQLLECLDLHTFHGQTCLRDTQRARIKCALIEIGRPATREEIGALSGMEVQQVTSSLGNVEDVVRSDMRHWAMRSWTEEDYQGVSTEIERRIEENGGSVAIADLMEELPRRYGVQAKSVESYAWSPKFRVKDGQVSLAEAGGRPITPLEKVISGWDLLGHPYWDFRMEKRYLEGYSIPGIPPAVAQAVGCEPGGGVLVEVVNLPGEKEVSVRWPLTTNSGGSIGRVRDYVQALGMRPGDRGRLTIVGEKQVKLTKEAGKVPAGERRKRMKMG